MPHTHSLYWGDIIADLISICDGQEKLCEIQDLPLDKSHYYVSLQCLPFCFGVNITGFICFNIIRIP